MIDAACASAGQVELKVSAKALKTDVLCGNEVATVPKTGQVDTVVNTLLVEVGNSGRCRTSALTGGGANLPFCPQRLKERPRW